MSVRHLETFHAIEFVQQARHWIDLTVGEVNLGVVCTADVLKKTLQLEIALYH